MIHSVRITVLLVLMGCSTQPPSSDTGPTDTAVTDMEDAGTDASDAETSDASTAPDTSPMDVGVDATVLSCTSPLTSVDGRCQCVAPSCRVICDGETHEGYGTATPFVLGGDDSGGVIRGCVFRDGRNAAIRISGATDILIEDCTFQNIRSLTAGVDVHAINIPSEAHRVTIRRNHFSEIGADGVQMGHASGPDGRIEPRGNPITEIHILDNVFVGGEDVGENAIDIKTTTGPIVVRGNDVTGFRPCDGDTQDCSGANGAGMVVHRGATGVLVDSNRFHDNRFGLVVSHGSDMVPPEAILVVNNWFYDNLRDGLTVRTVHSIEIFHNTFVGRGSRDLVIVDSPSTPSGWCRSANGFFVDSVRADTVCAIGGDLSVSGAESGIADLAANDLHLLDSSPAIGRGISLATPVEQDIDGDVRDSEPDVGADELVR